jgi:hypothetical protein
MGEIIIFSDDELSKLRLGKLLFDVADEPTVADDGPEAEGEETSQPSE